MHKILLLSAASLIAVSAQAATKDSFTTLPDARITGMSPTGKYVVGYNSGWNEGDNYKSFIYDVTTGTTEWKTEYDKADLDKCGQFRTINDAGMAVGALSDKDLQIEVSGGGIFAPPMQRAEGEEEVTSVPITSAALWKADGTLVKLGIGSHQLTEFSDATDGSYAVGISADGSRIAGYIQIAWTPTFACQWVLNPASGEYEYSELSLPSGCIGAYTAGISTDGTLIYGTAIREGGQHVPCYWDAASGQGETITLADHDLADSKASAISANGKYLLVYGYDYTNPAIIALYEPASGEMHNLSIPSTYITCEGYAVSDKGEVLCMLTDQTTWASTLYYYSMATGSLVEFQHYVESLEPELETIPTLGKDFPVACSNDFSVIAANSSEYGGQPWVLTLKPKETILLNSPQPLNLFFSAPDKLTFQWAAVSNVPEGATITEYVATVADKTVSVTPDQAVDGIYRATVDAAPGTYTATVKAVAGTAGGTVESAPTAPVSVSLSAETDWHLFDNWDNCTQDPNGNVIAANDWWNASLPSGVTSEVIQWSIESYNYENNTPYYTTTSISTIPWSSVLLSRFLDASEADNFYVSYYMSCQMVNSIDVNTLKEEYFDVEYSTDGEHWTTVSSHRASDMQFGAWNFYKFDLTPALAGKTFQLRFNAHGMGKGSLKWNLDCVSVNDKLEAPAPTGLKAVKTDNSVNLTWRNTIDTNEVSYLLNSNILTDHCTGSEGTPLITAVDLTPEMTDPYAGKYITSLSCFLFDNPAILTNQPTKAEAIVYANGSEVSRSAYDGEFTSPFATVIPLEKSVQIEEGKTYRIAIRIFDYSPEQTPVYYQAAREYIPGVTDLFSEDEGKTWQNLSDVLPIEDTDNRGMCIWPIRANITEADKANKTELDENILVYNVLRDGEVINTLPVYAAYLRFTDEAPVEGAKYAVQAFYRDGRISPISEAVEAVSSVGTIEADRPFIDVIDGAISVSGDVNSIEVYAVNGVCVARTAGSAVSTDTLADGIYLVRVKSADKVYTRKIAVRN